MDLQNKNEALDSGAVIAASTVPTAAAGGVLAEAHPPKWRLLPELRRGELWTYFGPAFVASVAYIDPGNFATNIEGGTRFGYKLLWVLLWSNAMAILVQYLSAKLGIVTGRTLPQNCRDHFSRPMTIFLWIAAEISAVAGAGDEPENFGRRRRPGRYGHGISPRSDE